MNDKLGYPLIISSPKLFEYCRDRYPKRNVVHSPYLGHDDFYYFSRRNKMRLVRHKVEIWVTTVFPSIARRRGRRKNEIDLTKKENIK